MAFKGINPEAQSKFNQWHLCKQVVDEFVQLARPLTGISPNHLAIDSEGLCFVIDVDDPQDYDPDYGYMFELRIHRNDIDFWVSDIHCTAVTGDNEIAWSSKKITE